MKLLMFYATEFWYRPYKRTLELSAKCCEEAAIGQSVVIFYQAEAEDEGREEKIALKWAKNAKWLAGKFSTKTIVLHSFNHLSGSKAPLNVVSVILEEVRARLKRAGFTIRETPFGYSNEWKIHVSGESLAKVFKEI